MKRLLFLFILIITIGSVFGQVKSDSFMGTYNNTYIRAGLTNGVRAVDHNTLNKYVIASKIHKDSIDNVRILPGDTCLEVTYKTTTDTVCFVNRDELVQYLDDLLDVDLTNVDSGDILRFDDESNLWKNVPMPAFASEGDSSQWELTGDDIVNKNSGDVTVATPFYFGDSAYALPDNSNLPILAEGEPLGWVLGTRKGTGQYVRVLIGAIGDSSSYSGGFFARDSANGYLYAAELTDKIGIGTATPGSNLHIYTTSYGVGTGLKFGDGSTELFMEADNKLSLFIDDTTPAFRYSPTAYYTAFGIDAGGDTPNNASTYFGHGAGRNSSAGISVFIGPFSGDSCTGVYTTAMGYYAAQYNVGEHCVAIGNYALANNNTSGEQCVAVGDNSLQGLGGINTLQNTAVGYSSGASNQGSEISILGWYAAKDNTGSNLNAIGINAAENNTGDFVTALGDSSCFNNTYSNVSSLGHNSQPTAANQIRLGVTGQHVSIPDSLIVLGNAEFENDVNVNSAIKMNGANLEFNGGGGMASDLDMNSYNIGAADTINTGSITFTDPVPWMDSFRKNAFYATDFMSAQGSSNDPWFGFAVASGTMAGLTAGSPLNHPGQVRLVSSTTTNSGYRFIVEVNSFNGMQGGEVSNLVFRPSVLDSVTTRFGFHDANTATAPVDGAYFEVGPDSILWGKTMKASVASTTGTSYTLTVATWYRLKIVVNADATRVDFYVYDDAGTQLWTNNLTTNIPTDLTGHGLITTKEHTGTGAGIILMHVDYMDVYLGTLIR